MKPKINLQESENILFECQPQKNLMYYLFIARCLYPIMALIFMADLVAAGQIYKNTMLTSMESVVLNYLAIFVGAFIVLSGLGLLWCKAMVSQHWYFFTNQRCIIYSGFWGVNKRIIPYARVVDVDMNRNPFRNIFGFSAIILDQQGTTTYNWLNFFRKNINPNLVIVDGIEPQLAEKITDSLSKQLSTSLTLTRK